MREKLIKVFLKKNKEINLSAIRDADGVFLKHIKDSLELNKILKLKNEKTVCDIGTGGGFPLLPLAIENPGVKFVGLDARRKKVDAVNSIIKELGINNAECKRSRIEDFEDKFDYITARAVGYIDKIIPWSIDLLKKGGLFILYKKYDEKEFKDLQKICKKYKLKILEKYAYKLFEEDIKRIIYVLKK